MESFLHQVAAEIAASHPTDTDRVLVVFNNRRSLRFFERQFATLGRTMFLPRMTAIDDLVAELGGLRIMQPEFLLFELYAIHRELEGEERKYQTFDEFIAFGEVMVADFSELDQYCVDAADLFGNLHDLKAIGEWDIEGSPLTEFQRRYLRFYRSLYDYYRHLRARLQERGMAYGGMAYRHVAENIGELADRVDCDEVCFVGFNAISECERRIIGEFHRRGKGRLFTDNDSYFMQPEQEAGHFLRRHCGQFAELRRTGESLFAEGRRRVTIVECPENLLQSKMAGQLLEDHPEWLADGARERTAVVLADESLLMPTLGSLPEGEYGVNISMGTPFCDSNMHLLAMRLLAMHATATQQGYHHTETLDLLGDRYAGKLLGGAGLKSRAERWMRQGGIVRCTGAELREFLGGYDDPCGILPDEPLGVEQWIEAMRRLTGAIVDAGLLEHNRKELQSAGSLVEILDYLTDLQQRYHYIDTPGVLQKIYLRIAQRHQTALLGEPLSGLQVMGMLETRNLDFDRVMLLSAGEGVLPASRSASSLVPFELKCRFGLPTYQEKDSVYAYNFYHLLLRAGEVYLFYSSQSEAMGKGEPSRFLRQVESELAPRFGMELRHLVVNNNEPPTAGAERGEAGVEKSEAVVKSLRQKAADGLTPTGFEVYLQCPLSYYYTRVLSIGREEELGDDLDASQLGTCIHNILQRIYTPFVGGMVPSTALRQALKDLPQLMADEFGLHFSHGRSEEGRNYFLRSVAETQLRALLEREAAMIEDGHTLGMVGLEVPLQPVDVCTTDDGLKVRLRGKADRIDVLDGRLRVVDYKTGSVSQDELTFRTTPNRKGEIAVPGKWFQLMSYALLYARNNPGVLDSGGLQVCIYPLRHLQTGAMEATIDGSPVVGVTELNYFQHLLAEFCLELLDPASPFVPTRRAGDCHYCEARTFCQMHP